MSPLFSPTFSARLGHVVWSVFWQSSLLIVALLLLDLCLRQRASAAFRHALWLLVLVKLLLPPSLCLPTGLGYWLAPASVPIPATTPARQAAYVRLPSSTLLALQPVQTSPPPAPAPSDHTAQTLIILWFVGAVSLLALMAHRSLRVARILRQARPASPELQTLFDECRLALNIRSALRLQLSPQNVTPATWGLRSPRILLPQSLVGQLSRRELRSVLLHELHHVKRHDVWVNCLQAVLQVLHWWNPLVWIANSRIRATREEAVDQSVLAALGEDQDCYADALLSVARTSLVRAAFTLGIVGIFESTTALHRRIRLVLNPPALPRTRLSMPNYAALLVIAALTLPMAGARSNPSPSRLTKGGTPGLTRVVDVRPTPQRNSAALPVHGFPRPPREETILQLDLAELASGFPTVPDPTATNLTTRTYRVATGAFLEALQARHPEAGTNYDQTKLLKAFLAEAQFDSRPPRSFGFSFGTGRMMVHATTNELARIESVLATLNPTPSLVQIDVRFIQASESALREADAASWLKLSRAQAAPATLTREAAEALLESLENHPGIDLLAAPRVTTLDGHQTQIQIVDIRSVPTDLNSDPRLSPAPTAGTTLSRKDLQSTSMPARPTLDVIPVVSSTDRRIRLTALFSLEETPKDDSPAPAKTQAAPSDATTRVSTVERKMETTTGTVPSGCTLVFFDPADATGRPFRIPGDGTDRLLIFITPTLIGVSGDPMYAEPARIPARD